MIEVRSEVAIEGTRPVDMKLEVTAIPVSDVDRAKRFYSSLGWRLDADFVFVGWRWIELRFPGAETALHFNRRKDGAASDEPVLVLVDDDVEATVLRLKSKGVQIVTEPQEAPWQPGRIVAEFRDSEGNRMVIGSR